MSLVKINYSEGQTPTEQHIQFFNSLELIYGDNVLFNDLNGLKEMNGNYYLEINDFDEIRYNINESFVCISNNVHLHLESN